jgi:hypothetical protein
VFSGSQFQGDADKPAFRFDAWTHDSLLWLNTNSEGGEAVVSDKGQDTVTLR